MTIICTPGTSSPAPWGATLTITPALSVVPVPGVSSFSTTKGVVELMSAAGGEPLEVMSWAPDAVKAVLPGEAPAGPGPYAIRLTDGAATHVANLQTEGLAPPTSLVEVPTLLVLFRLKNFAHQEGNYKGAALILSHAGSSVDKTLPDPEMDEVAIKEKLNELLIKAGEALNPGSSPIVSYTNYFTGLDRLQREIPVQQSLRVGVAPAGNLGDYHYFTVKRWDLIDDWEKDAYAEDTTSALVLLGPKGTRAKLYNYRNFKSEGGALSVEITDETEIGAAVIPDLHTATPVSQTKGGCSIESIGRGEPKSWGDMFGSVELEGPTMWVDQTGQLVTS